MDRTPSPGDDRPASPSAPARAAAQSAPTQWSSADTPQHHLQGTSYFSQTSSSAPSRPPPPPILVRSSHRDEGVLSEEDEDADEENDGLSELESAQRPSRRGKGNAGANTEDSGSSGEGEDDEGARPNEDDPITLKDRQSLINVQHPFGLPIWKPALYKKSRSVTRHADEALHSIPSYQAERHLLPGNIFWGLAFGWWLALACFAVSFVLWIIPRGGKQYANLVFGLGWYLAWPFGKYLEGDLDQEESETEGNDQDNGEDRHLSDSDGNATIRAASPPPPVPADQLPLRSGSWDPGRIEEGTSLLHFYKHSPIPAPIKSYGAIPPSDSISAYKMPSSTFLGKACFWLALICIIAPLMLIVCLICWALVVTIPMAKLNWALIKHLFERPDSIRFSPSGTSTVLLCTYRAVGLKYYKYTVGGVNILFVNLLPVVFLVIFDGFVLLPWKERLEHGGGYVPALLAFFASQGFIFVMSLLSVIPLSYFIGMAVASISAQSSIGMGAVINATFGSIIEIILYAIALSQRKGHLVEGSIIGSLLAGVLLMPGMSMCSGALRRKEQKFNAKSASVTSMMLIMAIIGALTPTLFYQTYGNFQLVCTGCPSTPHDSKKAPWICDHCYYKHPDPVDDPFYQSNVKSLMYFCAAILLFSYLVGLWFSLRTHASQIWQNPQQLLHPSELPTHRAGQGGHGGHDAPSWSRTMSASVLLGCTALYAIIAELLVDVVDVVLKDSGIDEKFLGVTLFALVPNTTEFMNAISFALNGNIALSMEIGSAYALQVCLLQIPAMVAFSAWYDPKNMGEVAKTFTLIFPRWDVASLILSMFLMTYTYIEAKSNYHRGSILIMSYLVLVSGFYFAPPTAVDLDLGHFDPILEHREEFALTLWQSIRYYFSTFDR
ncbi:Low affinity vacuolar monovalent cation/H(+) antiporter [Leucoagaricus sp. SymC.cos]|nr:Low affinity vacuolar monovalent cation/H(+) antiporter [Leucoagaricus sp. SymC.cos]